MPAGPVNDVLVPADKCPACGSRRIRPFKKGTFDPVLLDETRIKITDSEYGKVWDLSVCPDCGHLFADPAPKPEYLFALYSRVKDPAYEEESEGRSQNFLSILRMLEGLAPSKGALFDVGAATGLLLRLARDRGWTVGGVEASVWAVRTAEEKYGLRLTLGAFDDIPSSSGPFQAVTMIDIIEHLPEPRRTIAKAYDILAPDGLLCLVTPDIHSLSARIAGQRWWHLRPGHLAYFSAKSLDVLLTGAGFRVVRKKRYAWTFSAFYLIERIPGLAGLAKKRRTASFLKRIRIKLTLRDSFEIYAVKERRS